MIAVLIQLLQTCLPAGSYCDVISGNKEGGSCSGKTITVNGDGTANISISNEDEDPIVAIHAEVKLFEIKSQCIVDSWPLMSTILS
jgi:alpha-amylase